jgi:hypothetical protein
MTEKPAEYRRRRDFRRTPEPKGRKRARRRAPRFGLRQGKQPDDVVMEEAR